MKGRLLELGDTCSPTHPQTLRPAGLGQSTSASLGARGASLSILCAARVGFTCWSHSQGQSARAPSHIHHLTPLEVSGQTM